MSKHTPGPWIIEPFEVRKNLESDCGIVSVKDGRAYSVARCPRYQGQDQWEADSKLIAAAPELLEALEAMLAASMADGYEGMREATWKARAALAKASP